MHLDRQDGGSKPSPSVVQADNGAAANGSSKRVTVANATAADAAAAAATPNWSAGATQIGPGLFLVPSAVPGARALVIGFLG